MGATARIFFVGFLYIISYFKCDAFSAPSGSSITSPTSKLNLQQKEWVDLQHVEFSKGLDDNNINNEPVIFLHGLLGNKKNFSSLGASLSNQLKKKRRIFGIDLRNHGENHHDWRNEMKHTDMAGDVVHLMETKLKSCSEKFILIGHSMGGKVAMSLALKYPQKVAGLVIIDIAPVKYSAKEDKNWSVIKNIVDSLASIDLEGKTKRDIDSELRPSIEDPALRAFVLTNIDTQTGRKDDVNESKENQLRWKININSIAKQLDVIADFDIQGNEGESLEYNGDTFIIHGGASRFVRSSHMSTFANYFPNHMLTTIRGSGHWVHAEAPDDTLALLKRYLDR